MLLYTFIIHKNIFIFHFRTFYGYGLKLFLIITIALDSWPSACHCTAHREDKEQNVTAKKPGYQPTVIYTLMESWVEGKRMVVKDAQATGIVSV